MEKKCKHCNQSFNVKGRVFSNHVRWCEKNPYRNKNKIAESNRFFFDNKLGKKQKFIVRCFKCKFDFEVIEREKKHPEREKYFCSRSCANGKKHSEETKNKISSSLKGRKIVERVSKQCKHCNEDFEILPSKQKKKFCSSKCHKEFRKPASEYLEYKKQCQFDFNIGDFAEKFNFDLIKKHGWYKPKNRGDNLGGVSRDHKISIAYGWENNIDPSIISHPSNCQLMVHSKNISKNKKCSITLEQLKLEIENWE